MTTHNSAGLRIGVSVLTVTLTFLLGAAPGASAQVTDTVMVRGHRQTVHLYGTRGSGDPIVVSSGDGGWMHLGPHVAETLASHGYFVVGVDVKAYLESFTGGGSTLKAEEEPGDYRVFIDYAQRGATRKPLLIGVSEGAGLSVLAASDPAVKAAIGGVIGLGLPNVNELGWRWQDSVIYFTHGAPKEPSFRTVDMAQRLAPIPLAAIHSTSDEFVPLTEVQQVLGSAAEPKRLWIIKASNHRFSDNLPEFDARLLDAIGWVRANEPAR